MLFFSKKCFAGVCPERSLESIEERSRRIHHKAWGFTLLELLIVVIIIGILGTLALPRFFRAVERTRWAEAKSLLGSIRAAQLRYYAENSIYTTNPDALDLDYTTPKYFTIGLVNSTWCAYAVRNAVQNAGYTGQYVYINVDGTYWYPAGVPAWLR